MSANPKLGRPTLPERDRRGNVLNVRFSNAELEDVQRAAGGYPVSIWIRIAAIEKARREEQER